MYQKSILAEKEKPYSKKQIDKLMAIAKEIEAAKKDPNFIKALKQFIKETT